MSSLGDLLQGKVRGQYPSPPNDVEVKQDIYETEHKDVEEQQTADCGRDKPDQQSPQSNDDFQKLFPNRIEKRKFKDDDNRSNASSTDDYVQELLDPNDRPRNVWHVVEGPKVSPDEDNKNHLTGSNVASANRGKRSHHDRSSNDRLDSPPTSHQLEDTYDTETPVKKLKVQATNDDIDDYAHSHSAKNFGEELQPEQSEDPSRANEDKDLDHKSSSRLRRDEEAEDRKSGPNDEHDHDKNDKRDTRRSSSSRHHHRDRHSSRDTSRHHRDKDSNRDDRDKKSHRSSRRRHDYSDDEHDGRHDMHGSQSGHGSRSRRHERGSRSSSRSRRRARSDSRSPSSRRNSRTVLVMQLSQRVSSRDLEDFFSDIGDVREVRLIMDSKTRRHKGIAYIEFEDTGSAAEALSLDGKKFLGAPLQIQSVSSERAGGGRGDGYPSAGASSSHDHHSHHHHSSNHPSSPMLPTTRSTYPSSRTNLPPNSYRIYIGGLHVGITDEMLKTIVEPFGHILRLELIKDRNTGASRGYAFVLYATVADGQEAVRCLDGFTLAGKQIRVSKSTEKGERAERVEH